MGEMSEKLLEEAQGRVMANLTEIEGIFPLLSWRQREHCMVAIHGMVERLRMSMGQQAART